LTKKTKTKNLILILEDMIPPTIVEPGGEKKKSKFKKFKEKLLGTTNNENNQ